MSRIIKTLASQTGIYGLSSILPRFLNYLLVPLHTWIFASADYGVVTELYAYMTFLVILLTYGMETGFFSFCRNFESKKVFSTSIFSLFSTSALFILICSFFNSEIANLLNYEQHPEYILYFGWIMGLDAMTAIPFAKMRLDGKAIRFALFKMTNVCVNILGNLFFLWFCPNNLDLDFVSKIYDPEIGVGYIFISNLIASCVTLLMTLPDILKGIIKIKHFDLNLLRKMLAYSIPLMIAGFAGNFNEAIDRVLLKICHSGGTEAAMTDLGIYGANIKIAVLMTLFIQAFRYAAEPFFFKNEKERNSKQTIAEVMNYFILTCLVIFLGVISYLDIVKYFVGNSYWSGLSIVPIMLIANMFLGIQINLSIWLKLSNQTNFAWKITLIGALISILGNYFLIPYFSYVASAWMHVLAYFVMLLVTYFLGKKYYPIPYPVVKILTYFLIAFICFSVIYFLKIEITWLNLIKNTICLLAFLVFVVYKEKMLKIFN